jgi:L,D-transpeptidase YbiS
MSTNPILKERSAGLASDRPGANDFLLRVSVAEQELTVWKGEAKLLTCTVSTSRFGLGDTPGSNRTPTGWHRVFARIGGAEPLGRVFISREPRAEVVPPDRWREGEQDRILTRILWLEGLEPGVNGHSRERYIYLHGTNREDVLGTPASHGCIRLGNRAIAEVFDLVGDHPVYCHIGLPARRDSPRSPECLLAPSAPSGANFFPPAP